MQILLVEDKQEEAEIIEQALVSLSSNIALQIVGSRDSALRIIDVQDFDLVICDLKIPSEDGALDKTTAHGLAVRAHLSSEFPGTPVIVLTGYGDLDISREVLETNREVKLFGTDELVKMMQIFRKKELHACLDKIGDFAKKIEQLEAVEVISKTDGIIEAKDSRIMKIMARNLFGTKAECAVLPGGLTKNRVYLIDVFDKNGGQRGFIVGKIGPAEELRDEQARYRRFVTPVLEEGSYPPEVDYIDYGAGELAGFFQRRIEPTNRSLFNLLEENPQSAAGIVGNIRKVEEKWLVSASLEKKSIHEIRQGFLTGELPLDKKIETTDWSAFEKKGIVFNVGIQHGDLHPGNVLLKSEEEPLLIDFGRTTDSFSMVTDPITLELSLLFHPSGKNTIGEWPSTSDILHWHDLEQYLNHCPTPEYIMACREWAESVADSMEEILAVAYCFASRQLKFQGVNHDLALAIMNYAREQLG